MDMVKGKVYDVDACYTHTKHSRAEYHSSHLRCDGKKLHNMIIRMMNEDLEMVVYLDDDVKKISEEQVV